MEERNRVTEITENIIMIDNVFIPMRDGAELAARIWMPKDKGLLPVPAVLEYIPYRRRDNTASRDFLMHTYFAEKGYASVRVDIRGSGDSDGVLTDEYLQEELDDGVEVINWISKQEWCSGNVGMIGISWGGFNGLQIAAMTPPQLKCIVTVASTDDRYADDVHYMGGCLLGDNLSWASVMFAYNSCPPDPEVVGGKWEKMWFDRLKNSGLWLDTWLRHQRRDDYWKHGSVCEDFSRITCPVYAVSGWSDGYTNAVFRLIENLNVSKKGLIGPWSHLYPHLGKPGPAINFLDECVRWWDKWLKDIDNDIMDEPVLKTWILDVAPPQVEYKQRPGRWVGEDAWPSPNINWRKYRFSTHKLTTDENESAADNNGFLPISSPLNVGMFGGKWCSYTSTPDLPYDQRREDGGALVFDSDPLEEDFDVLGSPTVRIEFSSNKPKAMVAVRLSRICPNDEVVRITYGLLNLTHRNSHEHPEDLVVDKKYQVDINLNNIGQKFIKGDRLRVAISTSYWPLAWPSPEPVKLNIYPENSYLMLPIRIPQQSDKYIKKFGEPKLGTPLKKMLIEPHKGNWWVIHDLGNDKSTLQVLKDDGRIKIEDTDMEIYSKTEEYYTFFCNNYNTVKGEVKTVRGFNRKNWEIETITRTILTSDENYYRIRAELDAYEGETRVFSKSWDRKIPRDYT